MKLKVITFNIRYCDDENGHSIKERAPRLKKVVEPYEADIIGLQECTPPYLEIIEKYWSDKYEIFNKYRAQSNLESTPILWRKDKFECLKKGWFWLSDTPEEESKGWDEGHCYRICLYAVLKDKESGKIFTAMNTHFGFGDKCQTDSVRLVYDYSRKISDNPTFITGDFNMTPETVGYKEMTKLFADVNAQTAKDMRTTFHGYDVDYTGEHIDYCFINSKVKPEKSEMIDALVDGKFPSDHYGIYFELSL